MPSPFVGQVAKRAGVSMATAEKYWKEAKAASAKSYDKDTNPDYFWGTTTKIFKRKANKHLGMSLSEMDDIMESFMLAKTGLTMNNFKKLLEDTLNEAKASVEVGDEVSRNTIYGSERGEILSIKGKNAVVGFFDDGGHKPTRKENIPLKKLNDPRWGKNATRTHEVNVWGAPPSSHEFS